MAKTASPPDDHAWEKRFAPRVTVRRVIFLGIVFLLWIGFLAFLATQRWFGALR
ncbi:MAG: hypothetical protein ACE5E1_11040 [Phycisphaerae bacterium]